MSSPSPINATVVVAALGLCGTLASGILVDRLTRRREQRAEVGRWNVLLFEHYEAAYRAFLATWSASTSTVVLQSAFKRLQQDAFVPPHVVAAYERALSILEASPTPAVAGETVEQLRLTVSAVISATDGFAPG